MYLIIIPILLIDALASNSEFILKYRVEVGAPINILDALLGLGLLVSVLPLPKNRMRTERIHPLMLKTIIVFAFATIAGSLGTVLNNETDNYYYITTLRNFLAVPMAAWIGYGLIHQPKQVRRYCFWYTVAGIGSALAILLFFKDKGEEVTKHDFNVDRLRSMEYGPAIAGIAACFLIYQWISDRRMWPLAVTILLAGLAYVGQCATLSRSDWVAITTCCASIYWLIPKERRLSKAVKLVMAAPVLAIFLIAGVFAASHVTKTDFTKRMADRLETLMPGERETSKTVKAWDTRLASQIRELELWTQRPFFGQGFGMKTLKDDSGQDLGALGHNTWTFSIFQAGPLGLLAQALVAGGCWIVGRRMIRDAIGGGDLNWLLMGGLGALSGMFFIFHGLTTASFDTPRPAIFYGLTFGVLMRARAMQLELMRQQHELEAYYQQYGYTEDGLLAAEPQLAHADEPVFGNWYQPN